jgi:transposase
VLGVEQWAELRRRHFVQGTSIRQLQRDTGLDRKTIRRVLRSDAPPRYARGASNSKLDPFKDEIHRLLHDEPQLPNVRVGELIAPLGYTGHQTILDAYLRDVRPLFAPPVRTYQRTVYRPGELCQFDLWRPRAPIPVGFGQTRPGYVVVAALGYSRTSAGALVFSKEAPDLLWGIGRCVTRLGGLPQTFVWDREGALHAGGGRPSEAYASFCGQLPVGWHFCARGDAEAKGVVERVQQFMETSFEPGRLFAGPTDFQLQLDGWFDDRANPRLHRTLRVRPVDRLQDEGLRPLPERLPDVDWRTVVRIAPDPYVRIDTNDYSLDPRLVGRRVLVRASQSEVRAVALDTGELAAAHPRTFARHQTITAPEHARALRELRGAPPEPAVELRPLIAYDRLIPA